MKSRLVLWLLALSLASGFVLLGRWQLHRALEKQQLLNTVAGIMQARQAQSLSALSLDQSRDYAWVSGDGRFASKPALLLDNQRRGESVGVRVFRIFQPDQGRALLVDLGWLPLPGNRNLPNIALVAGTQPLTLAGLLAPPPSPGLALGPAYVESDRERWLLTRIDVAALSKGLNIALAPRILRLDPALALGYARDLKLLPNTLPPERHRGYALQWFGLATVTLAFALFLSFRRHPP